jgi:hypothetical protein
MACMHWQSWRVVPARRDTALWPRFQGVINLTDGK